MSINAFWLCDGMLGYDEVVDAAVRPDANEIQIASTDNQYVIDRLCDMLELSHDWQVYLFDEEHCDGERIAQWIREDPQDTIIIVDNRMGEGPHMQWLCEPGVLGEPARNMVIVVNHVDGEFATM